ncbi:DUF4244 domain-containing protein [Streptomyces sp. TS71-3]|uniref:DUF4244 domain-containing protein n=1 Tax=Streptomyces sp. TS71-3 TaxID=2733862 RepID=UPI0020178762|nr:DUF4244 domain-containing protein [Streptomyces sp. TS71-3]
MLRRTVGLLHRVTIARIPVRDAGMTTAEYAMGMIVAVALAGVLYKVVTSPPVSRMLQGVVERALNGQF